MPNTQDIRWFKQTFGAEIAAALNGTAFDSNQIVAIACQETGYIWSTLRKAGLTAAQITALCVGDTIDFKPPDKGRSAFPRNKAALLAEPQGQQMFDIARAALVGMAQFIDDYRGAAANPVKFCHGFGIFQRDLQFFKDDPEYFLQRRYEVFADTLQHCLAELRRGVRKLDLEAEAHLGDADFCKVAIAYNTGRYKPSKGLRQGYFDGVKYYGEYIADYLALSRTVSTDPVVPVGQSGQYRVIARGGLKLRSGPGTNFDWDRILPLGTLLQVVHRAGADPAWARVDLQADGIVDGYVFASFLEPVATEAAPAPD